MTNTYGESSTSPGNAALTLLRKCHDVDTDVQESAIKELAAKHDLTIIHTLVEYESGFDVVRGFLEGRPTDVVLIYRFDCLTTETLSNLGAVGSFFHERSTDLKIVTETIEFKSGYRGCGPTIRASIADTELDDRLR